MIVAQISDTHLALNAPDADRRIHDFADTIADNLSALKVLVTNIQSDAEITLFESQGLGLQDVAMAGHVYQKAVEAKLGQEVAAGLASERWGSKASRLCSVKRVMSVAVRAMPKLPPSWRDPERWRMRSRLPPVPGRGQRRKWCSG